MTATLQDPRDSAARLGQVAVACMLNGNGGTHVGFLYRREDASIWFCDVAWELWLRNEPKNQHDMCWVNIGLPDSILELVAAILEEMDKNKGAIPYDVRYSSSQSYFDPSSWEYTNQAPGLTCATFVMALFQGLQIALFNVDAWPSRPGDEPALDNLISHLAADGVDPIRIQEMRTNHKNVRFRPEEVCGSVGETTWPVPFPTAEPLGHDVRQYVMAR